MMTLREYKAWDGTFTNEERAKAEERERAMFDTLTEEEINEYYDLCQSHVYAFVDYGKAEENRTAKVLYNFCKAHNFSIEEAMMVY